MAVVGLPRAGVSVPRAGAPPAPSAALQQWVATHYAAPLRAGVLQNLARNPARAAQLTMPNVGQLLHPGGFDISRYHLPAAAPTPAVGAPATSAAPAAPANPYAAYPDYVQSSLRQMDADQTAAQQNATTTAAWLSPALQALQQGQQQAQGAYATTLAGLYQNPGTQGPAQVAPTSPGGVVSAPINAALQAQQQASPLHAAAQQQMGATQSLLGNLKVGDLGAGALGNLAYQAAQIPNVFAANKQKYLQGVDQALAQAQQQAASDAAKLAEQQREFGIQQGNVAAGQQLNYTLGLAKLAKGGTSGTKVSQGVIPIAPGTTPPAGYNAVTAADGNTYAVKAPATPASKVATGSGGYFLPGPQQDVPGTTAHAVPGGFRYLPVKGASTATSSKTYQTLIGKWSTEANKRLQGKRVTVGTNPATGAKKFATQGQQHPEAVFQQMLASGVKPKDAYRIVNANAPTGSGLDSVDVYNALSTSSLTEKQARQLAISLTGQDPVVAANPGIQ